MRYRYLGIAIACGQIAISVEPAKSQTTSRNYNQGSIMPGPQHNVDRSSGWPQAKAYWQSNSKARKVALDGQKSFDQGRYEEAESFARKALSIHARQAEALLLLAQSCEQQNKQAEALKAYEELVYSNKKGWGSSINSGITTRMKYVLALLRSNKWPEAVAVYDMAIKSSAEGNHGRAPVDATFNPNRREVARLQAVAHLILGTSGPTWGPASKDEQKKHLEAAARLGPDLPLIQVVYAEMLAKQGDYAGAKAAYRKAGARATGDLKTKANEAYDRINAFEARSVRKR